MTAHATIEISPDTKSRVEKLAADVRRCQLVHVSPPSFRTIELNPGSSASYCLRQWLFGKYFRDLGINNIAFCSVRR